MGEEGAVAAPPNSFHISEGKYNTVSVCGV
jgi:hypothetical protein